MWDDKKNDWLPNPEYQRVKEKSEKVIEERERAKLNSERKSSVTKNTSNFMVKKAGRKIIGPSSLRFELRRDEADVQSPAPITIKSTSVPSSNDSSENDGELIVTKIQDADDDYEEEMAAYYTAKRKGKTPGLAREDTNPMTKPHGQFVFKKPKTSMPATRNNLAIDMKGKGKGKVEESLADAMARNRTAPTDTIQTSPTTKTASLNPKNESQMDDSQEHNEKDT